MSKYRKKPVVIEAVLVRHALKAAKENWKDLPAWLIAEYDKGGLVFVHDYISIPTLEGVMKAEINDWIIRGVKGELYPCKPDIFEATYEPVDD